MAFETEPAPLIFTRESMRRVDREAIEILGIPGLLLMERAALGLCREVLRRWGAPDRAPRFTCICGPGNNGGDGWAAARLLRAAGVRVLAIEVAPPREGSDAGVNRAMARTCGVPECRLEDWRTVHGEVVIDAVLGTGADRPSQGRVLAAIEAIAGSRGQGTVIVSADIPSGLDADRGAPLGRAVRADLTVTFAGIKQGLLVGEAATFTGHLVVVPIGVPRALLEAHGRRRV